MPPPLLADLGAIDLTKTCLDRDEIYRRLPHRYEFMLLDGVCHIDEEKKLIVAYHDVKPDHWWVRAHVPGRPLLPGVLMLEMAAQVSAVMAKLVGGFDGFIAFGGVDRCKFRETVSPPARFYLLSAGTEYRKRRIVSDTQGVVEGRMIFEARITGMMLPEGRV